MQNDLRSELEGFCRRLLRLQLAEEEAPVDLAQGRVLELRSTTDSYRGWKERCGETDEQRDFNLEMPPEPEFLSSVERELDGTNLTLTPLVAQHILNQLEEVGESPPIESCKSRLCPYQQRANT